MNEQKILSYIELVRSSVPNAVEVFTQGNCGSFARMLLYAFPEGEILKYLDDHFVFHSGRHIYDITGNVDDKYDYNKLAKLESIGNINKIICQLTPKYKDAGKK